MDYPSGYREAVYMNDYCRQKSIRLVVRRHAVVVANFTEQKLVEILHYLIGQGVFRYPSAAAQEFPNLHEAGITFGVQSPTNISIEHRLPESQTHEMATIDLSWLREVYALAELYGILTLKRLALEKFNKTIQENVQTHRFLASVEEAYTSTVQEDRGLRDAITEFFYTHPDLLDEERVQHTLRRTENLSFDIVMYWRHDRKTPKKAVPVWGYPVGS
ncbi:polyketide synthase [Fusarium bulbicola]|nr:polyketide synthase [Fusarium bulbicola]